MEGAYSNHIRPDEQGKTMDRSPSLVTTLQRGNEVPGAPAPRAPVFHAVDVDRFVPESAIALLCWLTATPETRQRPAAAPKEPAPHPRR